MDPGVAESITRLDFCSRVADRFSERAALLLSKALATLKGPMTKVIGSLERGYRGYIRISGGYIGVYRVQIMGL